LEGARPLLGQREPLTHTVYTGPEDQGTTKASGAAGCIPYIPRMESLTGTPFEPSRLIIAVEAGAFGGLEFFISGCLPRSVYGQMFGPAAKPLIPH